MLGKDNRYPHHTLKKKKSLGPQRRNVPGTEPGTPLARHDKPSSGSASSLKSSKPVHRTVISNSAKDGQRSPLQRLALGGQGLAQPVASEHCGCSL